MCVCIIIFKDTLLYLILYSFQNYEVSCKDLYVTIALSLVHSSPFSPFPDCTIDWQGIMSHLLCWYISPQQFKNYVSPILLLILKRHTQLDIHISCFEFILVMFENLRFFF